MIVLYMQVCEILFSLALSTKIQISLEQCLKVFPRHARCIQLSKFLHLPCLKIKNLFRTRGARSAAFTVINK